MYVCIHMYVYVPVKSICQRPTILILKILKCLQGDWKSMVYRYFSSFQTTLQDDKYFALFSHLSRTFIPLYMYIYVHPPFPQFVLYQLTGWSSQCVWWWGKLLGLPCRRRWQSKQKATKPPSSVGLPGLCTEPLLLWGRRKSKIFHLAEGNPDPHCSCIAQEN